MKIKLTLLVNFILTLTVWKRIKETKKHPGRRSTRSNKRRYEFHKIHEKRIIERENGIFTGVFRI